MISPFNLPSDPKKEIRLREATAGDALDFSDIDAGHEEAATSLFLNTVQDKSTFYDAKEWTGEDRRFALVWYFLHTEQDTSMTVTYDCDHCGEEHTFTFDLKELSDGYADISGKPEREFEFDEQRVIVRPLTGTQLETLEMERLALVDAEARKGVSSGEYRKQKIRIKLRSLAFRCEFPGIDNEEKETKILSFEIKKIERFLEEVGSRLADMQHGLPSEYKDGKIFLVSPPHSCPQKKEMDATTRIRVPFRTGDFIPEL
jgi:hypothetical protein